MFEREIFAREEFRFSEAALAAGLKPKDFRNWTQRNNIKLPSPSPSDNSWRKFSIADMCVLGLMRPLVDYGMSVADSNYTAMALVTEDVFDLGQIARIDDFDISFSRIVAAYVWPNGRDWKCECFTTALHESPPWPPSIHAILLRIDMIWQDVFNRAGKSLLVSRKNSLK